MVDEAEEGMRLLQEYGPWACLVFSWVVFGLYHLWRDKREKEMRVGYKVPLDIGVQTIKDKDEEIGEMQARLEKNLIDEKKECNEMMRKQTEALTNVHGSIQTMNALVAANNTLLVEVHGVLKDVKENR